MLKRNNISVNILICCIILFFYLIMFNMSSTAEVTKIIDRGTLKLAHCEPEIDTISTPYKALTSVFKTIVERDSNGRFEIDIFPDSQLGDSKSQMEQCARGIIELTTGQTTGLLATYYSGIQVLDVPYLFPNLEIADYVLNGDLGKKLEQEILERSNLKVLAWMPTGFRNYSNNSREIRVPEDLKGVKLRTMEVPIHIALAKEFGANPIPIPWEELYTALQTGVAEGCDIPIYLWKGKGLHEVQKYYTLDRHQLNAVAFEINNDFYKSLTTNDQKIFNHAAREAKKAMMGIVTAKASEDIVFLKDAGVTITSLTDEEFNKFREIGQSESMMNILKETIDSELIDQAKSEVNKAEKYFESRW